MNVPTPTERTLSSAPHAAYASGFKRIAGFGIGLVLLLLCIMASLMLGSKAIPFHTVWLSLQGAASGSDSTIILNARVPRTLAGILAGMALGAAGALIQALTRNPLADPGVLGINAGASFAVVIGIMFFGAATTESYMAYAFVGAALTTLLVYLIGTLAGGRINPVRLTLAGVAIGAVLLGITTGLSLIDPQTFDQLRFWQAGTLDIRTLSTLPVTAPAILLGCLLTLLIARPLNTIGMGEDLAIALGARVVLTQIVAVIAITLLCGAATATVGPISFIGLMVPHIARWWVGPDQRWILPYSMLLAPILLLCADVVGRLLAAGELRVSIVAAFIGAPVLIWLVRRKKTLGGL
ncbi:TPA: Fe(3+)-siderophore ABC transporter permease [Serratia marcescens]|nr:Fe(3+)-siderophore ABC transporter permease [Serratia marcescens]